MKSMNINLVAKICSVITSVLISFMVAKLVLQYLDTDIYGFYQMSADFINYAMIITIALNSMANRYVTLSYYKKNIDLLNSYFNSILFSNIILGVFLLIPFVVIVITLENIINIPYEYLLDIKILFLLMFVNFILSMVFSTFAVSIFTTNRIDLESYRNIESNIIRLMIIILLFYFFEPKIWYIGIASIVANLYICITNIRYTKILLPEVNISLNYFCIKYLKEVLSSGVWNSFTRVGAILLNGLDLIIANLYVGVFEMGLISVAKTLPKMAFSSMSSVATSFTPSITSWYAKGENDKLLKSIKKSIGICTMLSNLILVNLFLIGERFYMYWVPNQDAHIIQLLSIAAMFSHVILIPLEPLWSIFTVTNKVKVSSIYLTIESIVTIVTVFILLSVFKNNMIKMFIIVGVSGLFETIRGLTFLPISTAVYLGERKTIFFPAIIKVLVSFILSYIMGFIGISFIHGHTLLIIIICGVIVSICTIVSTKIIMNVNIKE